MHCKSNQKTLIWVYIRNYDCYLKFVWSIENVIKLINTYDKNFTQFYKWTISYISLKDFIGFFLILGNILRHINYPCLCFPWLENPETLRQVGAFLPLTSVLDSSKMKTSFLEDNLPLYLYFKTFCIYKGTVDMCWSQIWIDQVKYTEIINYI